jgi:integrase
MHRIRHYFATRCRVAHIDEKVVQAWMGHSDYKTTLNIYTDVQEDFSKKEVQKLENQIKAKKF